MTQDLRQRGAKPRDGQGSRLRLVGPMAVLKILLLESIRPGPVLWASVAAGGEQFRGCSVARRDANRA